MSRADDVRAFMRVAGQATPDSPAVPRPDAYVSRQLASAARLFLEQARLLKAVAGDATHDEGSRLAALRASFMAEELGETIGAIAAGDEVGTADGLADLSYVVVGAELAFGLPSDDVWAEVCTANLRKFPVCGACDGERYVSSDEGGLEACGACGGKGRVVHRDAAGKVTKPSGWTPPDVAAVLERHRRQA